MAQTVHVYPKATLVGDTWTFIVKVDDARIQYVETSGVTATTPLSLLKISFDLTIGDTDTAQDVANMLYVDDVRPGPQVESVWFRWRETAEGIIGSLSPGYTNKDFWAAWSNQNTAKVRNDMRSAISGRGWTVDVGTLHWHEGDGTSENESV